MAYFSEMNEFLSKSFNLPAKRLDGDALIALEPALRPGRAGGWYYERDAHLRPDRLMAEWQRVLAARGVTIREHCRVLAIVRDSGLAQRAVTPLGDFAADEFVFATGALTPLLNRFLGCDIPIQPGKGYSITMPRPARCPSLPLIFDEHRVAVTPMRSGYRLGSTMEFAGYDTSLNPKRLDLLRQGSRQYLQ